MKFPLKLIGFFISIFVFTLLHGEDNGIPSTGNRVFIGIVIDNQDSLIPYFLRSIENLEYNEKLIKMQLNNFNQNEKVQKLLRAWIAKNKNKYKSLDYVDHSHTIPENAPTIDKSLFRAKIKDGYLAKSKLSNCSHCLILSSDVYLSPFALNYLISKDKPIIVPLLRPIPDAHDPYRNFFPDITENGYFKLTSDYFPIAYLNKRGTFKVPLAHAAYLIQTQNIDKLSFSKGLTDWEMISFSRNARENNIDQFICNEREFGTQLHFVTSKTPDEIASFMLAGADMEVNSVVLMKILSPYFSDASIKKKAENLDLSSYGIYRVENRDLYYLDEVNDLIKDYLKRGGSWEDNINREFKKYVKPDTVVIDIGGHIGIHALNLSKLVGPKGTVHVFEPQAKLFCEAAINMYLNKCENVKLHHNALGVEEKWIEIFFPDEGLNRLLPQGHVAFINEGHGTVKDSQGADDKTKMVTLDSFNFDNVSLIKIDVEGYEIEVIQGAKKTILRNHPTLIVEIYDNAETSKRIQTIENMGYTSSRLEKDDYLFLPKASIAEIK